MAATTEQRLDEVRTSEEVRPSARRRLKELYEHRQILMNPIRKEVRVKYTSSKLGAIWSMLNPLLYLAVFTLVFAVVLNSNIHPYAVYLLSGLLAWNLFSGSLSLGVRSVVDNANLVKKVYMPREVLPLASLGAVIFGFQRALFGNVGPCGPVPPNTYKQCVLVQASVGWEAMLLGCVLVGGLVLLYVFWRKFFSLSGDFAEEL